MDSLIQAIIPSLLMIIGGIITWFIKSRSDELRAVQDRLTSERRKIYSEILDPYIRLFSDLEGKGKQVALKTITSYQYKKTAFELSLMGSDNVVSAYNEMMREIFTGNKSPESQNSPRLLLLFARVLLEIRKSLGEKKTKLNDRDMLRSMINDIDEALYKGIL